jgi:predicted O-methyltransferase YrrM
LRKFTRAELGVEPIHGPFSPYLNAHETSILLALVRSVRPRVMIEFGCNEGVTAKRLLEHVPTLQKYIGIDVPFGYSTTLSCQRNEVPVNAGWYAADDPRFFLFTAWFLHTGQLEPCDAVFIDGDHSEQAVLHESRMARTLVRPGGIIVWHDFTNAAVEVTDALARLHDEGWPINCVEGSWLAFMRVENSDADLTAQGRKPERFHVALCARDDWHR